MSRSGPQKAFIISPIGPDGSALRLHGNWVRKAIIEKACDSVRSRGYDITPVRADDDYKWGHITDDVLRHIVEDRVVFVVLGANRPNCYFELGIAVAAGRPVIILRHEHEEDHFDTNDYRKVVNYRLPEDWDAEAPAGDIKRVADAIESVMQEPEHLDEVHGSYNPLGKDFKEWKVYREFKNIRIPELSKFFLAASRRIGLQGITLEHFANSNFRKYSGLTEARTENSNLSFFQFLRAKIIFDACEVTVLMMHQDNPALAHLHRRIDAASLREDLRVTRKKIQESYKEWMRFKRQDIDPEPAVRPDGLKGSLRVVQVRHGTVHYRLSFTEQAMILSPYINAGSGFTGEVPAIKASAVTPLFQQTLLEFDDLVEQNLRLPEEKRQTG